MLSQADTDLSIIAQRLLEKNIKFSFLVPTKTALDKSIIDAHELFRDFLLKHEIHNFANQKKGLSGKIILQAYFLVGNKHIETKISLYRPETKDGDPRIWIYDLKKHALPSNVISVIFHNKKLYILNCSDTQNLNYHLASELFSHIYEKSFISPIAKELLEKMNLISAKGFIRTVTAGDTGIGITLEKELGIKANSNRAPDYKGIELKSKRNRSRKQKAKDQLFSKSPMWKISPIQKASGLISLRGYQDSDNYQALRHTISGDKPNSLGLFLEIDYEKKILKQMHYDKETGNKTHDVSWYIEDLKSALLAKHKETFWVYAESEGKDSEEYFHYKEVTYTQGPDIDKFEILLSTGLLTVDYTMHIKENNRVRDHGYLFKLKPQAFHILFPKPTTYIL